MSCSPGSPHAAIVDTARRAEKPGARSPRTSLRLGVLQHGTSRLSRGEHPLHHYSGAPYFAEEVMVVVVPASGAIVVRSDAPLDLIDLVELVGCATAALHDLIPEGVDYPFDAIGRTTTSE